jgi:hypothetical protein
MSTTIGYLRNKRNKDSRVILYKCIDEMDAAGCLGLSADDWNGPGYYLTEIRDSEETGRFIAPLDPEALRRYLSMNYPNSMWDYDMVR